MIKYVHTLLLAGLLMATPSLRAQYQFKNIEELGCTEVKNQQRTGTCWSFATTSFLESEIIRTSKENIDLSEMYFVRMAYQDKAMNYTLRQGKANFSDGSLSHDVIRMLRMHGAMTEEAYAGREDGEIHNHGELSALLTSLTSAVVDMDKPSPRWKKAFAAVLDTYLGAVPASFDYDGKSWDARSFGDQLGINPDDYLSFTSFTHHPYHSRFVLEIPDNYANQSYYNVELDELMAILDNALDRGYSVAWDADVSEPGFSQRNGVAVIAADPKNHPGMDAPTEEISVTAENRQAAFEDFSTTDDHLMHIVGTAEDQNGGHYYIVKNSWGERGPYKGYIYVSETYMRMKTISFMVHGDAVPKKIMKELRMENG